MTDQEFLTYVRSLLNESTEQARFWTDAEIDLYKQVAISVVRAIFWQYLYPVYKTSALLTITENEPDIALPDDCYKIVRLEVAETREKVEYIADVFFSEAGMQAEAGANIMAWTLKDGKIHFLKTPTATRPNYLRLWYLKKFTTLAEFPEVLHPLIAIETVIAGKAKDENVAPFLEHLRSRFMEAAFREFSETIVQESGYGELSKTIEDM